MGYGDSQQYFLTVWLATSLLQNGETALDYYLYSRFCENPGNQCFVLGSQACSQCIANSKLGIHVQPGQCGAHSVDDMVERYAGQPAQTLYSALSNVGPPPAQVFDLLSRS